MPKIAYLGAPQIMEFSCLCSDIYSVVAHLTIFVRFLRTRTSGAALLAHPRSCQDWPYSANWPASLGVPKGLISKGKSIKSMNSYNNYRTYPVASRFASWHFDIAVTSCFSPLRTITLKMITELKTVSLIKMKKPCHAYL